MKNESALRYAELPPMIKDLTILAVTKMHGGVCTAGIDEQGRWVRPVRQLKPPEYAYAGASDYCLLPLDFFHGGQSHMVNLGVTRCWLKSHQPSPPHIEDWTLDVNHKPQLLKQLSLAEQTEFLATHAEANFAPLLHHERSLGLYQATQFGFHFGWNATGDDVVVRATFTIAGTELRDIGCTDLRLRALGRKLLAHNQTATLTQLDFARHLKQATYLAVGLSRLHHGKHWPILVGVHTLPELAVEVDYARL
ncbi:MAG TPA: hypothetical protein VFZ34_32550 [Blastocatellia bacterium]|nr:hypothetical protein [Blastocatellia bacterium]